MREILFRGKSLFGGAFIRRKYNDIVRVDPASKSLQSSWWLSGIFTTIPNCWRK